MMFTHAGMYQIDRNMPDNPAHKKFQVGYKTNMLHASSRKARLRAIEQELIFHLMVQLTPS